jgi:hypothetical protein
VQKASVQIPARVPHSHPPLAAVARALESTRAQVLSMQMRIAANAAFVR